jgi:peptide/nickel transport system substrate-binding protein
MHSKFDRRHFLKGVAGTAVAAGYMQVNPDFFISEAHAQAGKTMTFLSAENITGNWDPTAHTTLSQKNIEGFVMGFLTRTPMRLDNPDQVVYELATELKLLDPNRLQIKLRQGVVFHDGKPFKAEDVKATFEYGSRPDRPAQFYPGPTETLKIETPDDYTDHVGQGYCGRTWWRALATAQRHGALQVRRAARQRYRDGGLRWLLQR